MDREHVDQAATGNANNQLPEIMVEPASTDDVADDFESRSRSDHEAHPDVVSARVYLGRPRSPHAPQIVEEPAIIRISSPTDRSPMEEIGSTNIRGLLPRLSISASTARRFQVSGENFRERTVCERLQPTLDVAIGEKASSARKAQMTAYALNIAIGLQVLLGSLVTGLSAALAGRSSQVTTSILGGVATIVASYLARARGSNEPENSTARCKDLEQFLRKCAAFNLDHGHKPSHEFDAHLDVFRRELEELLTNGKDTQRKNQSAPV